MSWVQGPVWVFTFTCGTSCFCRECLHVSCSAPGQVCFTAQTLLLPHRRTKRFCSRRAARQQPDLDLHCYTRTPPPFTCSIWFVFCRFKCFLHRNRRTLIRAHFVPFDCFCLIFYATMSRTLADRTGKVKSVKITETVQISRWDSNHWVWKLSNTNTEASLTNYSLITYQFNNLRNLFLLKLCAVDDSQQPPHQILAQYL